MKIKKFEDIIAWQKSQELAVLIYQMTKNMQNFGYRNQYQRAAVSISNNIAEGFDRKTKGQFRQFLHYASGSCSEVKSMTYLGLKIEILKKEDAIDIIEKCTEISKIIGGLLKCVQ